MTELETAPEGTRMAWWGSREGIVIGRARRTRQPQPRPGQRRPAPPAERPGAE